MPTIRTPDVVPSEGWQYPAVAGPNIKSPDYRQLYGRVANHYRVNGKEPPSREAVDLWLCENIAVRCDEGGAVFRNKLTDPPSFLSRGMKSPDWPMILRPFKLMAKEGDRGLGDIVLRVIGPSNSTAFKSWFKSIFGKDCGCDKRQITLNQEYPL